MRIKELIKKDEIVFIDKRIKLNKQVIVSVTSDESQPYLYYICKRAMGKSQKITKKDIPTPTPYALVIDEDRECDTDIPIIRVKNARQSLALACSRQNQIDYKKLKIIGITGTNGKTTTATILYKILRFCKYNVGFIGTGKILYNDTVLNDVRYSMTTPDPIYLYSIIKRMEELGLVDSAKEFDTFLCGNGYDKRISVGTYEISNNATWEEIAKIINKMK